MARFLTQIKERVGTLPASMTRAGATPLAVKRDRVSVKTLLIRCAVLLPTLWAALFYGIFASDRYVAESHFVVRSSTRATATSGLANLLRLIGISSSQDDTFAVHDFITSRDAVMALSEKLPLAQIYGKDQADMVSRWPNLLYGSSIDEFHRYLKRRIEVTFNPNTGISTLRVQAFRPQDAHLVSSQLLDMSEAMINRVNTRIRNDSVRFAETEVKQAEERLRATQRSITEFRHREISLDPTRSSVIVMEVIGRLTDELSRLEAQIMEMQAGSPNSPQVELLKGRAESLRGQIKAEKGRVASNSDGLAKQLASYEALLLEREFATRSLASSLTSLETAKAEARRQQLYLERIAGPNVPDKALLPERLIEFISIFAMNMIVLLIGWLVRSGITEHAPKLDHNAP